MNYMDYFLPIDDVLFLLLFSGNHIRRSFTLILDILKHKATNENNWHTFTCKQKESDQESYYSRAVIKTVYFNDEDHAEQIDTHNKQHSITGLARTQKQIK